MHAPRTSCTLRISTHNLKLEYALIRSFGCIASHNDHCYMLQQSSVRIVEDRSSCLLKSDRLTLQKHIYMASNSRITLLKAHALLHVHHTECEYNTFVFKKKRLSVCLACPLSRWFQAKPLHSEALSSYSYDCMSAGLRIVPLSRCGRNISLCVCVSFL